MTLNILVPMAGRGSRFANAGYALPKPLIPVHGKPMIELVIDNVRPARRPYRFIFLVLRDHMAEFGIDRALEKAAPGCAIVPVDGVTEGAACTALLARPLIDSDDPLMTVNSDQYVDMSIDDYLDHQDAEAADGMIMTMTADDPKWSFVGFDANGRVDRVREKEVISSEATVGIYNFARGADFVRAADQMIAAGLRINGEFYLAPAYNEMIAAGAKLVTYNIGAEMDGMYGLGIPSDLERFLALDLSRRAAGIA